MVYSRYSLKWNTCCCEVDTKLDIPFTLKFISNHFLDFFISEFTISKHLTSVRQKFFFNFLFHNVTSSELYFFMTPINAYF